jgi:hypothetical protein
MGSGSIDSHFIDLGTSWRWVVNFTPRPLYSRGWYPGTHCIGGWVDPRASLDDMEKWKFLPLPGLEPRPLSRPARSQSLYRLRYPGSLEATITNLNLYIVDDSHPFHLPLRVRHVWMLEFKTLNLLVGWSQGWIVGVGNLQDLLHTPQHKLTPVFWSDNPHRSFHTQLPNDNYSCCSYGTDGSTSSLLTASTHAQMSSPAHLFFFIHQ